MTITLVRSNDKIQFLTRGLSTFEAQLARDGAVLARADATRARDQTLPARDETLAARDIAAGYASDAMTGGMDPGIATFEGIAGQSFPTGVAQFRVAGHASVRDPGGVGLVIAAQAGDESDPSFTRSADNKPWIRKFDRPPEPQDFGGSDLAAVNKALAKAARDYGAMQFRQGSLYDGLAGVVIPDGIQVVGRKAVLRFAGSMSGDDKDISIGAGCEIDELAMTRPNAGANTYWCEIKEGAKVGRLLQKADSQWAMNGVYTTGRNVHVGIYSAENIERAFDAGEFFNVESATLFENFRLDAFYARAVRRGLFLRQLTRFSVGDYQVFDGSTSGASGPGVNPLLIAGCSHGQIGNGYMDLPCEAAVRIGGNRRHDTHDLQLGDITALRTNGCAFKINPSGPSDMGRPQRARRISVGQVSGVDIGQGPTADNQEIVRISHADDVTIAGTSAWANSFARSGQWALSLNDCSRIRVGELGGNFNAGIRINQAQDADNIDTFGGNVTEVYVSRYTGTVATSNIISVSMGSFGIGNIFVVGIDVTGANLVRLADMTIGTYLGPVHFAGRLTGTVAPQVNTGGADPADNITLDMANGAARYVGSLKKLVFGNVRAVSQVGVPAFNPGDTPASGLFVTAADAQPGQGSYGGAWEASRPGSGRRAGAQAIKQTGSGSFNTGLAWFIGGLETNTDALREAMVLNHFGSLSLLLPGQGIELTSPNGSVRRRLTIDNSGNAVWTAV